jgi:uncharacterized protein YkwD
VKAKQKRKKSLQSVLRTHLRHAVVPHKGNHYRPHLVRLHGITAVLVLAVLIQVAYGYTHSGRLEVLGRVSDISATDIVTETNVERSKASMAPLQLNDQLSAAAFLKAKDMFANNYWAHVSPSGVTPWKWLADANYNYDEAGENLAKNYPTAKETVDAWMSSSAHRANIMNSTYKDIGIAVVDGMLDGRSATVVVAYYAVPTVAAVQAATDTKKPIVYAAPVDEAPSSPIGYFGSALKSLTPATLGTIALLVILAIVAYFTHLSRRKLPAALRRSWKRHHGLFTAIGAVGLALITVVATGGGQI